jgi:pyridoxine 5-phosphate synthase
MTKLSVNLNKIALLRNARTIGIPSVIKAAKIVVEAGADGVTVHPRPDERHIRYDDAYQLAEMLTVEYNIEGNPFTGKYMELVRDIIPDQATLVPDMPGANTSDHGWNLQANRQKLQPVINEFKELGIRVSLFMNPDVSGIELAGKIGADRVELYTEPYAAAFKNNQNLTAVLQRYMDAAKLAQSLGMGVNAGHDLNLDNLGNFCNKVKGVLEVSIGHALISDAIEMGLPTAVKEYLKILSNIKTD